MIFEYKSIKLPIVVRALSRLWLAESANFRQWQRGRSQSIKKAPTGGSSIKQVCSALMVYRISLATLAHRDCMELVPLKYKTFLLPLFLTPSINSTTWNATFLQALFCKERPPLKPPFFEFFCFRCRRISATWVSVRKLVLAWYLQAWLDIFLS